MRAGADSSHRALFYDRDVLLRLRECKRRLSVQSPSVSSMAIISHIRGEGDMTYSFLPVSKRAVLSYRRERPQPGFPCVLVGVALEQR
jgi:hypothetical protein